MTLLSRVLPCFSSQSSEFQSRCLTCVGTPLWRFFFFFSPQKKGGRSEEPDYNLPRTWFPCWDLSRESYEQKHVDALGMSTKEW